MIKVSYSQLGSFDRCKYKWFLSHHEGWTPRATKDYFQRGTFADEFLNIWYQAKIDNREDGWDLIQARIGEIHSSAFDDDFTMEQTIDSLARAAKAVKLYIEKFAVSEDKGWTFKAVQYELNEVFRTPKGREFILNGYIDLVAFDRQGRLWIWDHKTVGDGKFWSDDQLLADTQMPTYVAAMRNKGYQVFGCVINQLNLYPYKKDSDYVPEKLFRRGEIFHSQAELTSHVFETAATVDDLEDTIAVGQYRKSRRRDCTGCQFFTPCLLSMKNPQLENDVFEVNFTRRPTKFNGLEDSLEV